MGLIDAVVDMGNLEDREGLESYVKFPLEGEGRVIRVHLDVEDPTARVLDVKGVKTIDLADLIRKPEMKLKYLYRDRVGASAFWAFSPIHKLGRPKKGAAKNHEYFFGKKGDWEKDKGAQLFKIKYRLLDAYEREELFSEGSVDRIMKDLMEKLPELFDDLDNKKSHILLFGAADDEKDFLYPGEMPAFVEFFKDKLEESLKSDAGKLRCVFCGSESDATATLDKVFKFSTFDKVSILPGLDKKEKNFIFPVCSECLENTGAGRERIERTLTNTSTVPGIRVWVIPEAVGAGQKDRRFATLVKGLEKNIEEDRIKSPGEKYEGSFFRHLARQGEGLVFHFVFWERNNAQEMIHLMVEDVPPERLSFLERCWKDSMKAVMGDVSRGLNLDWAIKSLPTTLYALAGRSEGDKIVFRDFSLKIIGKMLQGQKLPVLTFKKFVVSRVTRLIYESLNWDSVQKNVLYAQVWVEFMTAVNKGRRTNVLNS